MTNASSTGMAAASNKGSDFFHQKEKNDNYQVKSWKREGQKYLGINTNSKLLKYINPLKILNHMNQEYN